MLYHGKTVNTWGKQIEGSMEWPFSQKGSKAPGCSTHLCFCIMSPRAGMSSPAHHSRLSLSISFKAFLDCKQAVNIFSLVPTVPGGLLWQNIKLMSDYQYLHVSLPHWLSKGRDYARQEMLLWPQVCTVQSLKVHRHEENTNTGWSLILASPWAPLVCKCLTVTSWQKWPGSFWHLMKTSKGFTVRSQTKGEGNILFGEYVNVTEEL